MNLAKFSKITVSVITIQCNVTVWSELIYDLIQCTQSYFRSNIFSFIKNIPMQCKAQPLQNCNGFWQYFDGSKPRYSISPSQDSKESFLKISWIMCFGRFRKQIHKQIDKLTFYYFKGRRIYLTYTETKTWL